ncbi:hypothetical protein [uncultured Aquabacterium sp.]|uniref:hypothetical protein n=2 Tax=Aquabacterium TaxID=92793 RepID=UPI0025ED2037|nr:hypothetical protein [uncultured Aquabacterium sp.]
MIGHPLTPTDMPAPRRLLVLACAALLLSGCAAPRGPDTNSKRAKDADVTTRMGHAAMTPLGDLNLVRTEIPAALQEAVAGPYALPTDVTCVHLNDMVHALDDALGPDVDAPRDGSDPALLERGVDMAEDASVSAVRRTVEGFVPFRSWLRKLSGAERHSRKVSAAITAGAMRRAYLKGLRQGQGCPAPGPAAPAPSPAPLVAPAAITAAASQPAP